MQSTATSDQESSGVKMWSGDDALYAESIYKKNNKGVIPPPPPLPKYDPKEEAPMWSWTRTRWGLPVEKPKPWTKVGVRPESDDDPDWRGVIRNKVIEYPMPDAYNLKDFKDKPTYFFFDTPDYADPFKKLAFSSKYFLKSGLIIGMFIWILRGRPQNLSSTLWMLNKITIPWFGAGMAASATVVTVSNLRGKKDDYWNYTAAGAVAGTILGRKNCLHWIRGTFLCIPTAIILKHAAEKNLSLWPQVNYHYKSFGLGGQNAENGFVSGDLRFGLRMRNYGDPGRDVRKTW